MLSGIMREILKRMRQLQIVKNCPRSSNVVFQAEIEGKKSTPLDKVVSTLKTMLKLTYQSVWDVVLQVLLLSSHQ